MSKPTGFQKRVIDAIKRELDYWATSNDIHSPSHYTSIAAMFNNLDEYGFGGGAKDNELDDIAIRIGIVFSEVQNLSPCAMREEQRKNFQP